MKCARTKFWGQVVLQHKTRLHGPESPQDAEAREASIASSQREGGVRHGVSRAQRATGAHASAQVYDVTLAIPDQKVLFRDFVSGVGGVGARANSQQADVNETS